ncbi:MAG: hypothetical protein NTX87_07730 [Planctomycetota bacterium]|nr:hypothetical protein [Planctomycetota bacterium]
MGWHRTSFRTLDADCLACGKPLTTTRLMPADEQRHPASTATVKLCVLCVGRALVRATLAIHGEPSPHPESHRCLGHEERMQAHEKRIRRMLRKLDRAGAHV